MNNNPKGIISEIERYAVNDGPGIRTVVFFKGCPLHCAWCSNPETQKTKAQVMYWQTRCIGCRMCIHQCPRQALQWGKTGIAIDRDLCSTCGTCVETCNSQALTMAGYERDVETVLEEILKDKAFFETSGGGVTFSGGEATVQKDFLYLLAKACKHARIHTCMGTCGYAEWETFETIFPYIDLFLFDIKVMDDTIHKQYTGVSNRLILDNFCKLQQMGGNIVVRIPIIPGINDTKSNLQATIDFLKKVDCQYPVSLLPYHRLGVSKYEKLDMCYCLKELLPPSSETMQDYAELFRTNGFAVTIGE